LRLGAAVGSRGRSGALIDVVTNIDRRRLVSLIDEGAQVVDVLPEREYTGQHIPGAVSIPLRQLDAATTALLRHDKPVVVY